MFNPNYCIHMSRSAAILASAYALGSIIFAAITAAMFYAISRQFQWEFTWISVISLLLAHICRVQCLRELRTRRLFQKYLADATHDDQPKHPTCTATVIGQN